MDMFKNLPPRKNYNATIHYITMQARCLVYKTDENVTSNSQGQI